MVQLKVFNPDPIFLDLYETDPIRLNMSIEDIKGTEATSIYSQSFRIPSTNTNNLFFRTAFSVNGMDFDVTIKHDAHLMVSGNIFKRGHIRLVKIYSSRNENQIEYEVVFLGETRNLSSAIGAKTLNELDTSDLVHQVTYDNITLSWEAQPVPGATNGLFDGNIIYPLINFGNNYSSDGTVIDTRMAVGSGDFYFTNPAYPLTKNRFKPMVRARWLMEKIFEEAGYTISSQFFDTELFMKTYVSAFGNDERNIIDLYSNNVMYSTLSNDYYPSWAIPFTINEDPGNNVEYYFDQSGDVNDYEYTVPVDGDYRIKAAIIAEITSDISATALQISIFKNPLESGSIELVDNQTFSSVAGETIQVVYTYDQVLSLVAGETIYAVAVPNPYPGATQVIKAGSYFRIPEAESGGISISYLLDNRYKQIDFVKDMLTTFRLIIEPSKLVENQFIIEPWNDYMGSGDIHDWTYKVDDEKDTVIEPIFYEQKERLKFTFAEDGDWLNKLNVDQLKENFGTLLFNSRNELLKGDKEYKTQYAATPVTQVDGTAIQNQDFANLVIPHIYAIDPTDDQVFRKPIRPKTRVMFWNGMKPNNIDGYTSGSWYMINDSLQSIAQTSYPRVSPYFYFPLSFGSPILMWQKEIGYVQYQEEVGATNDKGVSLYDAYWSKYVNLLYNPWSRKVTMKMNLNSADLVNFSFDDLIFIKGTYYYVSKIDNLSLEDNNDTCTVELIKFNPYNLPAASISQGLIWNLADLDWEDADTNWEFI